MIQKNIDYDKFNDTSFSVENKKPKKSNSSTKKHSNKKSIFSFITDIFSNKKLLTKILVTVFVIIIYRLLASVPLPGVDMRVFEQSLGSQSASELSYFFLIFTGTNLETPSIVGLGLAAYINASIIMQLLTPVIPKLQELSKDGARGQQIINQISRYLTLPFSLLYSSMYLLIVSRTDFSQSGAGEYLIPHAAGSEWPSLMRIAFMALTLTAGTMFLMWLAEVITENGIGNGTSIIISIGIIASLPSLLAQDFSQVDIGNIIAEILRGNFSLLAGSQFLSLVAIIVGMLLLLLLIIFMNESVRNIKIMHTRRTALADPSQDSSLPIKLTVAGVLPIIFASAFMSVPQLIVSFGQNIWQSQSGRLADFLNSLSNSFFLAANDSVVDSNDTLYAIVFFGLIVFFGVFYAFITLKPNEIAENLPKQSAYVPGVRPGKETEEYISTVLARVALAGGVFLAILAMIPLIARNFLITTTGANFVVLSGIGSTSLLIVVSVILEIRRQYISFTVTKSYERYAKIS